MDYPIFQGKDVEETFANNTLLELKLGYTTRKESRYADFIEKFNYNYAFLKKITTQPVLPEGRRTHLKLTQRTGSSA